MTTRDRLAVNGRLPCDYAVAADYYVVGEAVHAEHAVAVDKPLVGEVAEPRVPSHLLVSGEEDLQVEAVLSTNLDSLEGDYEGRHRPLGVGDAPAVDPLIPDLQVEGVR
jgi:hypothetical protein